MKHSTVTLQATMLSALAALALPASGQVLATMIEQHTANHSFENPNIRAPHETFDVATPGWLQAPSGPAWTSWSPGFLTNGTAQQHVKVETGHILWQDTCVPWAPFTEYRLKVAVGRGSSNPLSTFYSHPGTDAMFALQSTTANTGDWQSNPAMHKRVDPTLAANDITAGTFKDFQLVFPTGIAGPAGNVRLQLFGGGAAGRAFMDNVRLAKRRIHIGYWSMNEAGSPWRDIAGETADNATWSSPPSSSPPQSVAGAVVGTALSFQGTQRLTVPASPELNAGLSGQFTVSFRIKPDGTGTTTGMILEKRQGTGTGFLIQRSSNKILVQTNNGTSFFNVVFTPTLTPDVWQSVTVTVDQQSPLTQLYLNGIFQDSSVSVKGGVISNTQPLYIGNNPNASSPANSSLDELLIFDRVLDNQEILVVHNGNYAVRGREPATYVAPLGENITATPQGLETPVNTSLPVSLIAVGPACDPLTYRIVTNPQHGTVSGFNAAMGTFTYTPQDCYAGQDTVVWEVSTAGGTKATATLTITVNVPGGGSTVAFNSVNHLLHGTTTGSVQNGRLELGGGITTACAPDFRASSVTIPATAGFGARETSSDVIFAWSAQHGMGTPDLSLSFTQGLRAVDGLIESAHPCAADFAQTGYANQNMLAQFYSSGQHVRTVRASSVLKTDDTPIIEVTSDLGKALDVPPSAVPLIQPAVSLRCSAAAKWEAAGEPVSADTVVFRAHEAYPSAVQCLEQVRFHNTGTLTISGESFVPCAVGQVLCNVKAGALGLVFNDQGTPSSLDDQFSFTLLITGDHATGIWTGSAGTHPILGAWNVPLPLGPYSLNQLPMTITVSDPRNPGCTATARVSDTRPPRITVPGESLRYIRIRRADGTVVKEFTDSNVTLGSIPSQCFEGALTAGSYVVEAFAGTTAFSGSAAAFGDITTFSALTMGLNGPAASHTISGPVSGRAWATDHASGQTEGRSTGAAVAFRARLQGAIAASAEGYAVADLDGGSVLSRNVGAFLGNDIWHDLLNNGPHQFYGLSTRVACRSMIGGSHLEAAASYRSSVSFVLNVARSYRLCLTGGREFTGSSQVVPVLPAAAIPLTSGGTVFQLDDVPTGLWVDPPVATTCDFTMNAGGSLFTAVADFPAGFGQKFTVIAEGQTLGQFGPGERCDFVQRLGHGVSAFRITGIAPGADPRSAQAFPVKLDYSTPTASFTMTMRDIVDSSTLPPVVHMRQSGDSLFLSHTGALQASDDMINWTTLSSTPGLFKMGANDYSRLFFRAQE